MADNPNKKKKEGKQVSGQEHEKRYQATKKSGNKSGSKSASLKSGGRSKTGR